MNNLTIFILGLIAGAIIMRLFVEWVYSRPITVDWDEELDDMICDWAENGEDLVRSADQQLMADIAKIDSDDDHIITMEKK